MTPQDFLESVVEAEPRRMLSVVILIYFFVRAIKTNSSNKTT